MTRAKVAANNAAAVATIKVAPFKYGEDLYLVHGAVTGGKILGGRGGTSAGTLRELAKRGLIVHDATTDSQHHWTMTEAGWNVALAAVVFDAQRFAHTVTLIEAQLERKRCGRNG